MFYHLLHRFVEFQSFPGCYSVVLHFNPLTYLLQDAVFGLNGTSQSFESFSKISADMKFNSVLGDLKTENEKLEEHKRGKALLIVNGDTN